MWPAADFCSSQLAATRHLTIVQFSKVHDLPHAAVRTKLVTRAACRAEDGGRHRGRQSCLCHMLRSKLLCRRLDTPQVEWRLSGTGPSEPHQPDANSHAAGHHPPYAGPGQPTVLEALDAMHWPLTCTAQHSTMHHIAILHAAIRVESSSRPNKQPQ